MNSNKYEFNVQEGHKGILRDASDLQAFKKHVHRWVFNFRKVAYIILNNEEVTFESEDPPEKELLVKKSVVKKTTKKPAKTDESITKILTDPSVPEHIKAEMEEIFSQLSKALKEEDNVSELSELSKSLQRII